MNKLPFPENKAEAETETIKTEAETLNMEIYEIEENYSDRFGYSWKKKWKKKELRNNEEAKTPETLEKVMNELGIE